MITAETRDSVTQQIFEDRWETLLCDVERVREEDGHVGLSARNSRRFVRVDRAFEDLGALLVRGDLLDEVEEGALAEAIADIWREAKSRLIDWAMTVHATRERAAAKAGASAGDPWT